MPASSLPDLIRQSMRRRNALGESTWTTGSSPVVTKTCSARETCIGTRRRVARMSEATCGSSLREAVRISLRSSGLRLPDVGWAERSEADAEDRAGRCTWARRFAPYTNPHIE